MTKIGQQDDLEQEALARLLGGGTGLNQTQPAGVAPLEETVQAAPATDMAARKALGGYSGGGTMMGFNTALDYPDDKAATSVKNTFGRIASKYGNKPSSIDAVMADADFQRFFPGAKKVQGGAGDKIDFGGVLSDFESGVPVGVVDVLGAADPNADTSAGWTWQDEANDGGGGMALGGGGGLDQQLAMLLQAGQSPDDLAQSDTLEQILRALQASSQGGDDGQALLQSLLAGG